MHTSPRRRRTRGRQLVTVLTCLGLVLAGAAAPALGSSVPARRLTVAAPAAPATGDPDRGTWSVQPGGRATWSLSWRSPRRLPITGARPRVVATAPVGQVPAGGEAGVATLLEDGRTVTVTVHSASRPSPDAFDVVLSGRRLDEPAATPAPGGIPGRLTRWTAPPRRLLEVDPGRAGDLPVSREDYRLPSISVPGLARRVEMVGHVVKPATPDPTHPLVVLLHGRHDYCYDKRTGEGTYRWPCRPGSLPVPSHLGYDYLQRLLASQGYVTVSIAANGVNGQDGPLADGGTDARSRLVRAHLDRWAAWDGDTQETDLRRVVLLGHSRGGEGVSRASLEIPLSAAYRVVGQVLVAPTDFARQTTPYVPTVTLLPSCDGDVSDLQGQAYTDLSRGLATGDTALKSSVMVVGANHNFFNTQWTPALATGPASDDWGARRGVCGRAAVTRLTAEEQRRVGRAYVAGAVRLFAGEEGSFTPMYDGSAVRVGSTGDAVVLSHALGGGREVRAPQAGSPLTPALDAATRICLGVTSWDRARTGECGRFAGDRTATPHWPPSWSLVPTQAAFEMSWTEAGARGGFVLPRPLDAGTDAWLDLRAVVDGRRGDVDLAVTLTDDTGASATVVPQAGGTLPAFPQDEGRPGPYWAQTLRLATADLDGVDTSALTTVELTGLSADGRVWLLDVAAVQPRLAPVPVSRVPLVDLGELRVQERDGGTWTARVPLTVTGAVTTPAELRVAAVDELSGLPAGSVRVTVPVGATRSTIAWPVAGNDIDDLPRSVTFTGHAVRDVMARDHLGLLAVADDDPAPALTVRTVDDLVREGEDAAWRLTLSQAVGYPVVVFLEARRGDRSTPVVRDDDLGRRWARRFVFCPGKDPRPLDECELAYWTRIPPGERSLTVDVPLRQDGRVEPRESLTLRVLTETLGSSSPLTVRVARSR